MSTRVLVVGGQLGGIELLELVAQQVDRPRIRVESDLVTGKSRTCQLEPAVSREVHRLVRGMLGHEHDQGVDVELQLRRACNGDVTEVRRVESAAVEA